MIKPAILITAAGLVALPVVAQIAPASAPQGVPGAGAPPVLPIAPASRAAVYVTKAEVDHAAGARDASPGASPPGAGGAGSVGAAVAALGAVRSGDDRINLDVIRRLDVRAEGPVLHETVTEIYYIIAGGGNFETGGAIPNATPMAIPNGAPINSANIGPSLRGDSIVGGITRHVGPGDAVMIPPNVPHRFVTLDGSVTYLVVRINPGFEHGR